MTETCNPRNSEHLSTRETTQSVPVIPARSARQPGEAEIQTRKARTGDVEDPAKSNRQIEEEEIWESEKTGLGRGSVGRRVDWEG